MENAEKYLNDKEIRELTSKIVEYELEFEKDLDMLEFGDGEAEIETNQRKGFWRLESWSFFLFSQLFQNSIRNGI